MVSLFARFVGSEPLRGNSAVHQRSLFGTRRLNVNVPIIRRQIWSFLNLQQGRVGEMTSLSWGFLPEGTNGSLISRCNEEEFKRAFILLKYLLAETNGR